jgi:hypothetical protein
MPGSTRYTLSMCVSSIVVAAMLLVPTQTVAEQRKPSGTTTTTIKEKCNRKYTACVGDCYLDHGTKGADTRRCTNNCDHSYNRCMRPVWQ